MKVTLVNPLYENYKDYKLRSHDMNFAHMGLLTLETLLNQNGIETEQIDFNLEFIKGTISIDLNYYIDAAQRIVEKKPEFIGITSMANNYVNVILLAQHIKRLLPNCIIFLGGPQASYVARETLEKFPYIEFICRGEVEGIIPMLVDFFNYKISIDKIPGVTFVKEGKVIQNNDLQDLIREQDFISVDYGELIKKYNMECNNSVFGIEGGRGCPYNCTFCSTSDYWKRTFRLKEEEVLINEMKNLCMKHGIYRFSIIHDLFTCNKTKLINFCKKVAELHFEWGCSSRTDVLDNETIDIMSRSGCKEIFFGIETGDQETQKNINKNLNLDKADKIIKYCASTKINVTVSFIIGFPFESIESIENTLKRALKYSVYGARRCLLNILTPEHGSYLLNQSTCKISFQKEFYYDSNDSVKVQPDVEIQLISKNPNLFNHYYYYLSDNFNYYYLKIISGVFEILNYSFRNTFYMLSNLNDISIQRIIFRIMRWNYTTFASREQYLMTREKKYVLKKFGDYVIKNSKDTKIIASFLFELGKVK